MTQRAPKLLIIRPQPAAKRTVKAAKADGFAATAMPLFELAALSWGAPQATQFDGLLITSANALNLGGIALEALRDLPLLAVGEATAETAEDQGFTVAMTGNSDKADLLKQAKAQGFTKLLWLAGQHRTIAAHNEDIIAQRITVYESAELSAPDDFTVQANDSDAVLLFSPRAARHFSALFDAAGLDRSALSILALSKTIADAAGENWRDILIADEPREDMLLQIARRALT